jgi:type III secretory pathway component EscS
VAGCSAYGCSLFFLVVVLPIVLVAGAIGGIIVGIMAALRKL